jgi:hypothetical protein
MGSVRNPKQKGFEMIAERPWSQQHSSCLDEEESAEHEVAWYEAVASHGELGGQNEPATACPLSTHWGQAGADINRDVDAEALRFIVNRYELAVARLAAVWASDADTPKTAKANPQLVAIEHAGLEAFLAHLYSQSQSATERQATQSIYKFIHARTEANSRAEVDCLLGRVDPSKLLASSIISLLMATLPIRNSLRSRSGFGRRAAKIAATKWGKETAKEIKHYI